MSPGWIEFFGSAKLAQAFAYITAMTAPCWVLMIAFPDSKWVGRLVSPFTVPLLLIGVELYLIYLFMGMRVPGVAAVDYRSVKGFFAHPMAFLCFWCQLQLLNLFLGAFLLREAKRIGMRIRLELILCWITGPLALLPFSLRYGFRRAFIAP